MEGHNMPRRWSAILIAFIALSASVLSPLRAVSISGSAEVAGQVQSAAPAACTELTSDGGFEAHGVGWTQSSTGGYNLISNFQPHTGSWGAYLGGTNNADDRLSQQIVVPSNAISVSLSIWWSIATEEPGVGFDRITVSALQSSGTLLRDLVTIDSSASVNQWDQADVDLTQFVGQTIVLRFRATTNASSPTDFYVDDVSVIACSSAVTSTVTLTTSASPSPTSPVGTSTTTPAPTGTPRARIYLPIVIRKGV
jgi:hypothetical protein